MPNTPKNCTAYLTHPSRCILFERPPKRMIRSNEEPAFQALPNDSVSDDFGMCIGVVRPLKGCRRTGAIGDLRRSGAGNKKYLVSFPCEVLDRQGYRRNRHIDDRIDL